MSISRKARAANRAKALDPRPGRKPGATPLRKNNRRFEIAVFRASLLREPTMSHIAAAERAVMFHERNEISAIEKGGLVGLGFEFTGGRGASKTEIVKGRRTTKYNPELKDDARKNRSAKIADEAPKLIEAAQGNRLDCLWLEASARGLLGLLDGLETMNPEKMRYALKILAVIDDEWPRRLARLFQVHS
jgi:hypothetical protein